MTEDLKVLLVAILFVFIGTVNLGFVIIAASDPQYLSDNLYSLAWMYIIGLFFLPWGLWLVYDVLKSSYKKP
jgi:uncharacterized membrane protein YqjE